MGVPMEQDTAIPRGRQMLPGPRAALAVPWPECVHSSPEKRPPEGGGLHQEYEESARQGRTSPGCTAGSGVQRLPGKQESVQRHPGHQGLS